MPSRFWGASGNGLLPGFQRGAAAAAGYRYVKVGMTSKHGDPTFSLSRLEAYTALGGADVLAGSGATVTASSTLAGTNVSNLTDGNDTTYWASSSGAVTAEIVIDWGSVQPEIVEIGLRPRLDANYTQFPLDGDVSFSSDGVSYSGGWSFVKTGLDGAATSTMIRTRNTSLLVPGAAGARRIWGIKFNVIGGGQTIPHCNKIELRASIGGATYVTGGTGFSATRFSTSFNPNAAATGVGNFAMLTVTLGYWFYDFGEGNEKAKPAQLMLKATGTDPTRMPSDFDLIYRDGNGGPITVQQNFTSPAAWSANEERTFTVS